MRSPLHPNQLCPGRSYFRINGRPEETVLRLNSFFLLPCQRSLAARQCRTTLQSLILLKLLRRKLRTVLLYRYRHVNVCVYFTDVQVVFLCSFMHLTLMYICRKSGENGFAQNQSAPGSDSKFQFEVCSSYI